MKTKKASTGKILASYIEDNFVVSEQIYMPDDADETLWKEFNNEEEARKYYNVKDIKNDTENI